MSEITQIPFSQERAESHASLYANHALKGVRIGYRSVAGKQAGFGFFPDCYFMEIRSRGTSLGRELP